MSKMSELDTDRQQIERLTDVVPPPPFAKTADATPKYHGHMTRADGSHVALSVGEAKALWDAAEASTADRAARMPDDKAALNVMFDGWQRLKELGWREAAHCPKDGSTFEVIESGSTGIFRCHYQGEWPGGSYWIADNNDLWPSHPILYRLLPEAQAEYDAKMKAARERYLAECAAADRAGAS